MKTMKKLLPVAIAMSAIATPAMAEFSANIGATSNYVWRGVTQTNNGAAVSGGVDYEHESGIYAGTWVSNVDFGGSEPSSETDFYAGWSTDLGDSGLGLDVGYIYYAYLDSGDDEIDFGEIYVNLSFNVLSAGIAYTSNTGDDNEDGAFDTGDLYYWVGVDFDLGEDWSAGATVGYYDFTNDGDVGVGDISYTNAEAHVTKSAGDFGDFTLTVSYADEDAQNSDDDPITYVSWSKGF